MTKTISILLFLILCSVNGYAQQRQCEQIPVLLYWQDDWKPTTPYLRAKCVTDTLEIRVISVVFFNKNSAQRLEITDVILSSLSYKDRSGERVFIHKGDKKTTFNSCVWDACSKSIRYWLRNQPFDQLDKDVVLYYQQKERSGANFKVFLIPK